MTDSPFEAMRLLVERIAEIANKLHLELVHVAFMPEDTQRDTVSVLFAIKPEAVKSVVELEKERLDNDFAAALSGITIETDEEGNVILGGVSVDDSPELEDEISDDEKRLQQRTDDTLDRLKKWLEGE